MINKNQILREAWVWNESVSDLVNSLKVGYTLNAPSGKSVIGDVLLDIDPKDNGVTKADINFLPYEDNTFDTVIQDPPWKISYYKRMKPFFECVRVCKVNGKIIYNATWIPTSKYVSLEKVYVRQDGQFTTSSIISVFKKMRNIENDTK